MPQATTTPKSELGDDAETMLAIGALRPPKVNPNVMTPEEFAALKEGIRAGDDMPQPLVVGEILGQPGVYEIIDGEHRWQAVTELVAEGHFAEGVKLPCKLRSYWTEAQRTAWRIGLNHSRGHIRLRVAREQIADLKLNGASDAELAVTGFTPAELAYDPSATAARETSATSTPPSEEDAPPTAAKPFTLELTFASRAELVAVRRALKKAAGKSKDLSRGLMAALGMEAS